MADVAIEVRINPSNIQRLINEQVERITQHQYRQRENYLLRYLGLDPDQLARDRCTFVTWRNDQRMETVIEIRDINGNTIQTLPVADEVLYEAESSFRRLTRGITQVATAAASLAPALAQFGQAAIEAERAGQREMQRLRVAGWEVDGARDDCDCIFCQEYRDQHRDPAAQENARALLLSCLTPAQQEEYQASKSFTVKVRSGNRYRIETRRSYNVVELDKRYRPRLELCAGPVEDVPLEDQMLAQKLLLETDEAGFLAVANGRPVSRAMEYVGFGERMGYR